MLSQMVYHPATDSGSLWPTEGIQLLLTVLLIHDEKLQIIHLQPSESWAASTGTEGQGQSLGPHCPPLARHSLCHIASLPARHIYTEELYFSSSLGILTSAIQIRPWSPLMFYILSAEVGKRIWFRNIHPCAEVTEGHKKYILFSLFFLLDEEMQPTCLRMEWNGMQ